MNMALRWLIQACVILNINDREGGFRLGMNVLVVGRGGREHSML